jgi:hypothetical protein
MYARIIGADNYNAVTEWMADMIREGMRDGMRMHASNDYIASLTGWHSVSIGYLAQYETERYERGIAMLIEGGC